METQTVFDPVSRRAVSPGGTAISAVYSGRAYYFESRENRDTFERSPEKYLAGAAGAGQAIDTEVGSYQSHRRRRC